MITESLSHARENLGAIMDRVVAENIPTRIKRRGAEGVILVSESEWAGMEETIHLLSSPENARHLMESISR